MRAYVKRVSNHTTLVLPLPNYKPFRYKYTSHQVLNHSSSTCLWGWNGQRVPKRRLSTLHGRRGLTQKTTNYSHTTTLPNMSGPFIKCQYYLSQDVIHLVKNPKGHNCYHNRPSTGPEWIGSYPHISTSWKYTFYIDINPWTPRSPLFRLPGSYVESISHLSHI